MKIVPFCARYANATRRGNAMVIAVGVATLAAALVVTSATSSVQQLKNTTRQSGHVQALAAVEAVLSRRETLVVEKASDGTLLTWTGDVGQESNYGSDYFGGCTVKWKIEPARTLRQADVSASASIPYIVNPSPDPSVEAIAPEVSNDYIYLYRISAQATLAGSDQSTDIRAQGVRYVGIQEEPLFRYVIFYAPEGPKGDLELSHDGDVTLQGSVHSNGAIYIGSSILGNNWGATAGPSGRTRIGPVDWRDSNEDGLIQSAEQNIPVRCVGVNGIFRLSKPLMFGKLNGYPIAGTAPSWSLAGAIDDSATTSYPRDSVLGIDATELSMLGNGVPDDVRIINPYRIKDTSGFITTGANYVANGGVEAQARVINDRTAALKPILGLSLSGFTRNDARDGAPSGSTGTWKNDSAITFGGQARTNETGGRSKRPPKDLVGTTDLPKRALEAQVVTYIDKDADPTTDQHELAEPLFVAGNNNPTTCLAALGQVVEQPGTYLSRALGDSRLLMARRNDGSGWNIVQQSGATVVPTTIEPSAVGLVIRERQVPDTTIWPGTANAATVSTGSPNYMPFAYGKHWRPAPWPFFIADVSDGVHPTNYNTAPDNYGATAWGRIGLDTSGTVTLATVNNTSTLRQHSYTEGGTLALTAAAEAGRFANTVPDGYLDNWYGNQNLRRKPAYYNDNWRFVHMKKPVADVATGLNAKYFKNSSPTDESRVYYHLDGSTHPFQVWQCLTGAPNYSGTATQILRTNNITTNTGFSPVIGTPAGVTNPSDRFSVRWEGFVVPLYSEVYTFWLDTGGNIDDGFRMWVDGQLLLDPVNSWRNQNNSGSASTSGVTPVPLTAGNAHHIVIDYYQNTGADSPELRWSSASQASQIIPQTQLRKCKAGSVGFAPSTVVAVQAKLDISTLTGPANEKVGLMIRDGRAGLSPLMSGRDAYAGIFYNPTRGFFVQRRLAAAKPAPTDVGNMRWFIGGGTATQTAPSATTINSDGIGDLYAVRSDTGSATYNGITTTYNPVTRNGRLTRTSNVTTNLLSVPNYQTNVSQANTNRTASTGTYYLGDGTAISGVVYGGSGVASKTWTGQKRQRAQLRRTVQAALSSATGGFSAALDNGRSLSVYASTSTGTTTTKMINGWTNWTVLTASTIQLIADGAISYGTYANGGSATTTYTLGANYVYSGNPTQMNSVGAFGRTDWIAAPAGYLRSGTTISSLNPTGYTYPADSATSPPPAASVTDFWPDTVAHSFAVARTNTSTSVIHDVNSWISAWGNWFTTPVNQNNPWQGAWSNTGIYQITSPFALTNSFRPDLWYGKAGAVTAVPPTLAAGVTSSPITPALIATPRWLDDQPNAGGALPALGPNVFLRIERGGSSPNFTLTYKYYSGPLTNPPAASFVAITNANNVAVTDTITGWADLLIGPAVQSGSKTTATTAKFLELKVELTGAAADAADINGPGGVADGVVDRFDWDSTGLTGTALPMSRYLASQYQVFWGGYDISEDFFTYLESVDGARTATEDWFYSPREFYSQNRRWDHGNEKDGTLTTYAGHAITAVRQLLAKTTTLTLNMGGADANLDNLPDPVVDLDVVRTGVQRPGVQGYLKDRLLSEAVVKRITLGAPPAISTDYTLFSKFNGLIYAVRTNRYPYNPNQDTTVNGGQNPWSFSATAPLVNTFTGSSQDGTRLSTMAGMTVTVGGVPVHKLEPYNLPEAPAFKPQDFHHGVMVTNAADIYWGYVTNAMGESKTTICTPNQMYVRGNVNTITHNVTTPTSPTTPRAKYTPLAIFGDAIHLLSNSFSLPAYQTTGLVTDASGNISGTGILANPDAQLASTTTYRTCLLTHNIPTTRESVREGQSAAFVDTMMFMEDWTTPNATMNYQGSLVVFDSRRYSQAFLLDQPKQYGRTVFGNGISDLLSASAQADWATIHGPAEFTKETKKVFSKPTRVYTFNDDLLKEQGTPPFTPFGLTVQGIGGWSRVVQK